MRQGTPSIMKANATDTSGERLALSSSLSDLVRVPLWIEHLAAEYAISDNTQFAMNHCLDEVLSNVIRHGYAGQPGRLILVRFASSPRDGYFTFVIEDEAPHFNPLSAPPSRPSRPPSRRRPSAAGAFACCAILPTSSNTSRRQPETA
jgi:serine/threonine-protein kinase RsbW